MVAFEASMFDFNCFMFTHEATTARVEGGLIMKYQEGMSDGEIS